MGEPLRLVAAANEFCVQPCACAMQARVDGVRRAAENDTDLRRVETLPGGQHEDVTVSGPECGERLQERPGRSLVNARARV